MNYNYLKKEVAYFSRWTRKSWAVFSSLRKIIKISFLSTGLTLIIFVQKSKAQATITSEPDSIHQLEEVEVVDNQAPALLSEISRNIISISHQEIEQSGLSSIDDILKTISQTDIRQRGPLSIQSDISIRGSNSDQVLILINGISVSNLQTGHHNLDLPVSKDEIEKIEILTGPASRIYGPDAFAGAINFVTKSGVKPQINYSAGFGNYGLRTANFGAGFGKNNFNNYISIGTEGSSGYNKNTDFQNSRLYFNSRLNLKKSEIIFQTSAGIKHFGAQNFYTAKYPNQFESTHKSLTSLSYIRKGKIQTQISAYFKLHYDHFELFRIEETAPSWYLSPNNHQLITNGINSNFSYLGKISKTQIGLNFRNNKINSNVLGIPTSDSLEDLIFNNRYYTKSAERHEYALFFNHIIYMKKITISFGILANRLVTPFDKFRFYPGIDFSIPFHRSSSMYLSYSNGMRNPTFTDLYYQGPTNIGNSKLKPEKSHNIELGYKWKYKNLKTNLTVFSISGLNTIQWVRQADTLKWQPMNIVNTNSTGFELVFQWKLSQKATVAALSNIGLTVNFMRNISSSNDYQTNYADNFIKQKASIDIVQNPLHFVEIWWNITYTNRNGNYWQYDPLQNVEYEVPFGHNLIANFKISKKIKSWNFAIACTNIFNNKYYDFGNIPMPGRWFYSTVKYQFIF